MVEQLGQERPQDTGRACRVLKISRSSLHYQSVKDDSTIMIQLEQLAKDHPREGFWKCYHRMRNQGDIVVGSPFSVRL